MLTQVAAHAEPRLSALRAHAYRIPTDQAEADGTFSWDATVMILVEVDGGGCTGIGYTYADACLLPLLRQTLSHVVLGRNAFDIAGTWQALQQCVRNLGRSGLAAMAISAVDTALWDLKARLLDVPLARLLGMQRDTVPVYGSGGFTSYKDARLASQLAHWVDQGCAAVKMKIGSDAAHDPQRIAAARRAIGEAALFVDANGAFTPAQAIALMRRVEQLDISWFEEPVSSDDLDGLRRVRQAARHGCEIAAGEYAFTLDDARRLLASGAVDVLQADVSRCGGVTGFLRIASLCDAFHVDLSGHCAPALHRHVACAASRVRHLEWFHDHVRIEHLLFDGAPQLVSGAIAPDMSRPGHGLAFKCSDAKPYAL